MPVTGATFDRRERPDAHPDLVGLPRRVRGGQDVPRAGRWSSHLTVTTPSYYIQAISATAPDPAAARLWEEYLYSTTGQNLWLQGSARPIELASLVKDGTVDKAAFAALPAAPKGTVTFPTEAELTAAENVVTQNWASVIGG